MSTNSGWPPAQVIETPRLTLEPLRIEHAQEMVSLLDDRGLHEYIGGHPATLDELRDRYARQVVGRPADGTQGWLKWIARRRETGAAIGTVQATVQDDAGETVAAITWVVAASYQRQGFAVEAARGMVKWLGQHGVDVLVAYIHPEHAASIGVARRLGLEATDVISDGETRWTIPASCTSR
ncbi:MAG: GNAT family N-acetyltransferase [Actinomycetota bacterium]|nr:GNAT family N-acetyltransferase [Actinomycetota bacterium]